ncbi:MAG TPA: metalloregulator ArsR/SmtB family transcription factor [Ktedonosporobacter sp.]|nr:metalloregulator ArsR/SmtB family transcription factor [Ktedonosporobacter sp.]
MPGDADIASVAALLADPTRTGMLLALSDGRALPAGDLARHVRVSASTASNHLTKLVEHRLLVVEKQGRHRYFRLADPEIEHMLETLALFAPPAPIHSLRESEAACAIRAARMCYNHLAGELGVALAQALVEKNVLVTMDDGYLMTDDGEHWFRALGVDYTKLKKQGKIFAPHHIDWSERRHHVAGGLGAALARRFFDLDWVRRLPTSRAVRLTDEGQSELKKELGLCL